MRESNLFLKFKLAEAAGQIPEGFAARMTFATILESGLKAAAQGYYGHEAVLKAEQSVAGLEQSALDMADAILHDIAPVMGAYSELAAFLSPGIQPLSAAVAAHTISSFPQALAALRQRMWRQETPVAMPSWREYIPSRLIGTTPDFKPIRGIMAKEYGLLPMRPEGSDVQFTTMGFDTDQFLVANYARAIGYTWESYISDELGAFMRELMKLGEAAARTEAIVILNAIAAGVARTTGGGLTTGAPNIARLRAARQIMSERTVPTLDGSPTAGGLRATDLLYPVKWESDVEEALEARFQDVSGGVSGKPNPIYRRFAPHVDRLIVSSNLGADWMLFDNMVDFIDVRFLAEFQNGPLFYTEMPNVIEHPNQGSFSNNSLNVKVAITLGAKIVNAQGLVRVQGE